MSYPIYSKYLLVGLLHIIILILAVFTLTYYGLQSTSLSDYFSVINRGLDTYRHLAEYRGGQYHSMISYASLIIPIVSVVMSLFYLLISLRSKYGKLHPWIVYFLHLFVYVGISFLTLVVVSAQVSKLGIPLFGEDLSPLGVMIYSVFGLILYMVVSGIYIAKQPKVM